MIKKENLIVFIGLIPVFIWIYCISSFELNIPHWDDHALKAFLNSFFDRETFFQKLNTIWALHNEHRIALTRLITLISFVIFGQINYSFLIALGNAMLIFNLFLFYVVLIKTKKPLFFILAVSFSIFNFYTFENSLWGMASIQNYGILATIFVSLYLLIKFPSHVKASFFFAIFFAILAILTSGNGVLIFPIGLFFIVIQKKMRLILPWILCVGGFVITYFIFYEHRPDSQSFQNSTNWLNLIKGILVFAGSYFDFGWILPNKRLLISSIFGFLMIAIWLIVFVKVMSELKTSKSTNLKYELYIHAILIFCLLTIILVSIARFSYGIEILMTSKYKIYSQLLFVGIGFLLLLNSSNKIKHIVSLVFVIISFGIFINSYFSDYHKWKETYLDRLCENQNSKYSHESGQLSPYYKPIITELDNLKNPENMGIFQNQFDSLAFFKTHILFFKRNNSESSQNIFLKFKNLKNSESYVIPMKQQENQGFSRIHNYYSDSYIGNLNLEYLEKSDYDLDFIVGNHKKYYLVKTNKTFQIEGLNKNEKNKNW